MSGKSSIALNLVAAVVHARRTRLLSGRASGESTHIGVIAVHDERLDDARGWDSSLESAPSPQNRSAGLMPAVFAARPTI
ncbi:MAG: hypothetical protein B9S26_09240 [Opitutia bacterium Tous-C4FEB]|nr:MAG: hypothetical protein B9S35_14470 [Opitutae bacterium Tous-C5TDCM]PAW89015.1 MAG: hypothetical protein B9S26_09240 [Opitutae bacterium Tous-C4FEB]